MLIDYGYPLGNPQHLAKWKKIFHQPIDFHENFRGLSFAKPPNATIWGPKSVAWGRSRANLTNMDDLGAYSWSFGGVYPNKTPWVKVWGTMPWRMEFLVCGFHRSAGLIYRKKRLFPKDPFVCPKNPGFPWTNPILGMGLRPSILL